MWTTHGIARTLIRERGLRLPMSFAAASLPSFYFLVPGDLATPTGGYAYARAVLSHAAEAGMRLELVELPGSYPRPGESDLEATRRTFESLPASSTLLIDGLAFGAMPDSLIKGLSHQIVALVHHPLALETGIDPDLATCLRETERSALARATAVVITGAETGDLLVADYGVPRRAITLAEPGVDRRTQSAPNATGPIRLLSVGAVSPRKGYDVLVSAVSGVADLDWRLTIAGATDRDPQTASRLVEQIDASGCGDRITVCGAISDDELDTAFRESHVFLLASLFEGYGMVLTEATAYGLPIIASDTIPALHTLPREAAIGVPVGNCTALEQAIRRVISDARLRESMAEASWNHAQKLPTWLSTAQTIANVLQGVS